MIYALDTLWGSKSSSPNKWSHSITGWLYLSIYTIR